jgi:hypothetical protein
MQHRKLTCYLDVVFVWSVGGLDSAKNINLACESSLYCNCCIVIKTVLILPEYRVLNIINQDFDKNVVRVFCP